MNDARGSRKHRTPVATVAVDRPRAIRRNGETNQPQASGAKAGQFLAGLGLCVLLAGSLAGLVVAFQSDMFRVAKMEVHGASAQVRQAVEDTIVPGCIESSEAVVECLPGMLGPNELTLSGRQIEAQLEGMPAVKAAHVKPALPNRLVVEVIEREPEVAWQVGSETYRVAGDGRVMDTAPADGLKVRIGQVGGEAVKPGDQIDVNVIKGAELLQDHLARDFGIAPRRIQYSPAEGLAVIGDQEMIAMFGPPENLNLKMAELQRISDLAKGQKRVLTFVDLRYKTPYFRTN